ncbi:MULTISPECIES: hypothetical protein [unclassified Microbacterium]|uniref:hypothetical protein n=1 Tax=unclassified Microbacterium TaxID=2609290 RepID=UPI000CFB62FC|nr:MULTISPECIES: hypothetical protein [unclassified Microbacterium]PRB10735.1 hypothetical protein CQ047_06425 [Microbacterium sp. MYb72]
MHQLSATGNPWLDPAIDAIGSTNVYVDHQVKGWQSLQEELSGSVPSNVVVVVLPDAARENIPYDSYIVDKLSDAASQPTVIVAVGKDLTAKSSVVDDALKIANENDAKAATDLKGGLLETVQEISAEIPAGGGSPGTGGADVLMPVVIGGVVLIAAAGTAIGLLARRRRRAPASPPVNTDPVPAGIRLRVSRLRELAPSYAAVSGNPVAAETAASIDALASHIEQLFARLDAKAGEDQSAMAEAEYSDKLARLVAALDRDYLLDLLTRPDLWDDPEERIGEVREALNAVTTQIVDNIKQVNARKGLLFQVSLDSLIGRSELRDWERQFKQSSGD